MIGVFVRQFVIGDISSMRPLHFPKPNGDWHGEREANWRYSITARLASNLPDVVLRWEVGTTVSPAASQPQRNTWHSGDLAVSGETIVSCSREWAHVMTPTIARLAQRIQQEFDEAPGLKLTVVEGGRFWTLDAKTCADVLEQLLQTGFLVRTADGRYQRAPMT